jgi:O-acetyl-ADP-ribose deacetylase (regulator of RNase III)
MGKGIALEFKKRFPDNFMAYKANCDAGQLELGRVFTFDNGKSAKPRYIVNFPTKNHWREASQLHDISSGLESLAFEIDLLKISSIAIPALGCGLGGLDWLDVRELIQKELGNCEKTSVFVYSPL